MPPYRTRETARSLEVTVVDALEASAALTLNIVSPTPRAPAFLFAPNAHTPSPSPAKSPFEPDLRTLTLTPPALVPSPASSFLQASPESSAPESAPASVPALTSHRRRRSTASDINERRPKKGDDDYIKRPENAFILFRRKCCEDRNSALGAAAVDTEETGTALPKRRRQADLSKDISAQWKALTAEEKQYWEDLAKERKKAHAEQYPNYVYRPQRVKKGKAAAAAAKGKGKAGADDETGTDGELAFTMPVVVMSTRNNRRAASAPTPPPMHQQIVVPSLPNIPLAPLSQSVSSPTSPTEVASIASRRPSDVSDMEMDPDWTLPFGEPFTKPQGWHPHSNAPESIFNAFAIPHAPGSFSADECGPSAAPSLSIQTDALCLPPMAFEASAATSSAASSPHLGPYTPSTLQAITMLAGADMWQSAPLDMDQSQPRVVEPAYTYAYQPYSWEPGVWQQGCAPLFNEDFDISLIPPVTLEVPKFDGCAGADQCPPPVAIDIPFFDGGKMSAAPVDECEQQHHQRDAYMHTFHFDAALDLAARGEY